MLLIAVSFDATPKPIAETAPNLLAILAPSYFALACLFAAGISLQRPNFKIQAHAQALIDITAIALLLLSSGGVKGGLGILMVVSLASASILLPRRIAFAFAAYATLIVFGQQIYLQLQMLVAEDAYTHAGLLGMIFFACTAIVGALADKARLSEALAHQRGKALADMQHLARYVIERMQTGVAVINAQEQIWLINESGRKLLGLTDPEQPIPLEQAAPQLAEQFRQWRQAPHEQSQRFRPPHQEIEIHPRFAHLSEHQGSIIFLEDTTAIASQAQQLKLASMGRLAGSIAHEIRNPLGAISHASQLLAESPHLDKADQRLTQIIRQNCLRTNAIIENTLQLGRRQQPNTTTFELTQWMHNFVEDFCQSEKIAPHFIQLTVPETDVHIAFDTSQLHQILWNLCHNGARHSRQHCGEPRLELRVDSDPDHSNYHLDICDQGPGVPIEERDNIFEPFFTTENTGTGLGLYIARELSECNHSRLNIIPSDHGGACFRLSFPDMRRRRYNA